MMFANTFADLSQLNCFEKARALELNLLRRSLSFNREIADLARPYGEFSLTNIPVSPSLIESLNPGTLYPTAGVPIALDSVTTKPQPSRTAGTKIICALLSRAFFTLFSTWP